jgi:hypothetical protein
VAGHQAAHVGENVKFSFILTKTFGKFPVHPAGIAEYCVLEIDQHPVEMELDEGGKFSASYVMPAEWANREIKIKAAAYRQYGQRDRIVHKERLLQSDRAADPKDQAIARDAITMLVYQSAIEFKVEKEAEELDFDAAHLVVRKADGTSSTVAKFGVSGRGFLVDSRTESAEHTVRYEPACAQVNGTGMTQAELTVPDRAGRAHHYRTEFMTP